MTFWIWALLYWSASTSFLLWGIVAAIRKSGFRDPMDNFAIGLTLLIGWLVFPVMVLSVWAPSLISSAALQWSQRKEVTRR